MKPGAPNPTEYVRLYKEISRTEAIYELLKN